MSGDRIDLLAEIHRLKEENKELKRANKLKHEQYQEQKERVDKLENALDKACLKLTHIGICHKNKLHVCEENKVIVRECKECWKEWSKCT